MPPIAQLDEAFLSQLLSDENHKLNSCIDTTTLSQVLKHLNVTFADLEKELYEYVQKHQQEFTNSFQTAEKLALDTDEQAATEITNREEETVELLEKHQKMLEAHQLSTAKIDSLETIINKLETIEECKNYLNRSRVLEATERFISIDSHPAIIEESVQDLREMIMNHLSESIQAEWKFEQGETHVGNALIDVLESFKLFGKLTVELSSIKRMTFKYILNPFFSDSRWSIEADKKRLLLKENMDELKPVERINSLCVLVRFFLGVLEKDDIQELFAKLFLPDLMQMMVNEILVSAVPTKDINDFEPVKEKVREFERECEGIITENPLRNFVDNIPKHYAKKKRETVLREGRNVMLRRLYESERVGEYHITQTPRVLSMLIRDNPDAAADLLDMYRALMPSYHRPQLLAHPASALVFRNDCLWLARQQQPESQPLIELGKAWQELCMMQRVDKIQITLDALCGFSTSQSTWETTLQHTIHLVLEFAQEIKPVVDFALAQDILGRIVDSLLNRLMGDLQGLTDIGADESHVIALTLNSVAQLEGAFEGSIERLVSTWSKFWLLKDILEMNMREIMDVFRRGELHMFQKSELENLICALFADSELRRMNVEEIRTGQSSVNNSRLMTPEIPKEEPKKTFEEMPVTQVNKLLYNPDQEDTSGWDDEDDILALDEMQEGWDDDELELPPDIKPDDEAQEGWDDEDLFNDEKDMK